MEISNRDKIINMRIMIMCAWKETFFSMPMPPKDAPLKLLLAGFTHKDASYRIVRNGLDDIYVLEYVISGKGHLHWGDKYYTPTAGDVYLLQPHVSHEYYSDPADPWEKIWFNLSGPLMDALCDAYRLHGVVYFHHCRLEKEILDTAEQLRRQERNFYQEFALRIHRIISLIDLWRREHPEVRKSPEGIRLKEYLDANWQENISLGALASLIRKSPAQTLRIFQKDWNCSPYAYLQEQRSFLARQYLENSDYPVKILASMLGFKDEFYFSNWFKEKNGISPSAYRKRFRESLL